MSMMLTGAGPGRERGPNDIVKVYDGGGGGDPLTAVEIAAPGPPTSHFTVELQGTSYDATYGDGNWTPQDSTHFLISASFTAVSYGGTWSESE